MGHKKKNRTDVGSFWYQSASHDWPIEDTQIIITKGCCLRKELRLSVMENIRIYREKIGMTQLDLAKAVGVSEAEIAAYEHTNGKKILLLDTAIAIATVLRVTLAELVREDLTMDPPLSPGEPDICLGNGENPKYECCCDECDEYLTCFPTPKD